MKIKKMPGRYNKMMLNLFKRNLFFVNIRKKCNKKDAVRDAPNVPSFPHNNAFSDVKAVKVRKFPMDQMASKLTQY